MKCNNAVVTDNGEGRYSLTIPPDKQDEKLAVLKEAVEKYNGYCHVEISRVHRPKSVEANALFHALLTEYYESGCHSVTTWQELKDTLKYRYGAGFLHMLEVDGERYGILKSEADYNTAELSGLIDGTISEMKQTGVQTQKFEEILEGIEDDKK